MWLSYWTFPHNPIIATEGVVFSTNLWYHSQEQILVLAARLGACPWVRVCYCVLILKNISFSRKRKETGVVRSFRKNGDLIFITKNQQNSFLFYLWIYHSSYTHNLFFHSLVQFTNNDSIVTRWINHKEVIGSNWKSVFFQVVVGCSEGGAPSFAKQLFHVK